MNPAVLDPQIGLLCLMVMLIRILTESVKGGCMDRSYRGGKVMMEEDWRTAYNVVWGQAFLSYAETFQEDEKGVCFILPSPVNIEKNLINKDLIRNLSEEAIEVIKLLLTSPKEVLEELMPEKYKGATTECGEKYSKEKIRKRLLKLHWSPRKIDRTFQELRVFVTELES
jgi:hypothetical protein